MKKIVSLLMFAWISISIGSADNQKQDLQQLLKLPYDIQAHIAKHLLGDDIKQNLFDKFSKPFLKHILHGHKAFFATFNTNGTHILSAGKKDGTVRIWDAQKGLLLHILQHATLVNAATFNNAGNRIVSATDKVHIWDVETGALIHILHGHKDWVNSAVFNHDGTQIASASSDGTIRIWDTRSGLLIHLLHGHERWVNSAKFNTTGTKIVSAGTDKTVRIWDVQTGTLDHLLRGHKDTVTSAEFNISGTQVVSSDYDGIVRLWDLGTGSVTVLRGHNDHTWTATFNKTGTHILSVGVGKIILWDAQTGAIVKTCDRLGTHSAHFNTKGTCVVSAGTWDGISQVWNMHTGETMPLLPAHQDSWPSSWVHSALFNTTGTQVVTAGNDKTIRIWDVITIPYESYHFSLEQAIWIYNKYHEIMNEKKNQPKMSRLSEKIIDPFDSPFNFYCFALPQPVQKDALEISKEKRDQIMQKLEIEQSIKEQYPEIVERLESLKWDH